MRSLATRGGAEITATSSGFALRGCRKQCAADEIALPAHVPTS